MMATGGGYDPKIWTNNRSAFVLPWK